MIILVLLTLVASCYLSYACFCIIHRMTKRTPWSLFIAIVAIAALGAFGLIQSAAYLAGTLARFQPWLGIVCAIAAVILSLTPRINTERTSPHG